MPWAVATAVPEGASTFIRWCASTISIAGKCGAAAAASATARMRGASQRTSHAAIGAMIASVTLLGLALKTLPVGTGYAVWVGIGAIGAAIGALGADIRDADTLDEELLREAKTSGFSDRQIAALRSDFDDEAAVLARRLELGVRPVYKTVDTCAAEFASATELCTSYACPRYM